MIDISRTLNADTPTWPEDEPFSYDLTASKAETDSVNIGQFTTSCHTATHIDAPFHFNDSGLTVDQLPIDLYMGPVLVIDLTTKQRITPEDLNFINLSDVRRVILKTDAWPNGDPFPTEIPELDSRLGAFFHEHGVELVGVDLPSVDPLDSKTLDTHHAFEENDIHILEGVALDGVEAGHYYLSALPLKLEGADGSPVRAVLQSL
ncbi:arylformamidase [Alkalibacillus almallahensis]|uniref:arylformamidase n=1 Tax=Alkalibacillus almallahensis TaxID=1379154 RepID=UPI00141FDCED|nr:arylformamidase [Alkalibacillus almallahensis]NIK11343.1 arylformamidase [Alkalibacillus almallahensis]